MAAGDCAIHSLLILAELQKQAAPAPAPAPRRTPPAEESFAEWLPEEKAVWDLDNPIRVRFMRFGRGAAAWWAIKRTGAKISQSKTAREACKAFLARQVLEPNI